LQDRKILVIDDNETTVKVLKAILEKEGYRIFTAVNSNEALKIVEQEKMHLILLDLKMPDYDGLDLYLKIKEIDRDIIVVIMTAYGTVESAVKAMKIGIEDYIQKPINYDELKMLIAKFFEKIKMKQDIALLKGEIQGENVFQNMIGKSTKMQDIFNKIINIAKVDSTVLITGESGTGKEMVAKAIHNLSSRAKNKMISINLAAIPDGLQESELFGYVKGAFTGAYGQKAGKFELAEKGTIFLDEIANINDKVQAKLLRVLEDRKIEPLGSNKLKSIDLRIISATNIDLKIAVEKGSFREDLYYRLNVITLSLPPLRERKEDIPQLIDYFLNEITLRNNIETKTISEESMKTLMGYNWPGNIRELKNVIEEAIVLSNTKIITPEFINLSNYHGVSGNKIINIPINTPLHEIEKSSIISALLQTKGNQTRAAKILGITRKILTKKIQKYKLASIVPIRTKRK